MWSIIGRPCNQRIDLWVLSNRSSLNIVMQSWNCWPMFTYCPRFIPWLKHKGKKVQDPVYIIWNWINVLFNTPANPLIPGRWVSWWDNKVWSPFWYSLLCQTLRETNHTDNYIVRFWTRGWYWFWGPFSKYSFNGKMIRFLSERRKRSGYQLWVCQDVVTIIGKGTFSSSTFSILCESRQMEGMHIDSCDSSSGEEHLRQDCWNLASKSNNLEADLTTLKQTGLFLVFSPIIDISCWKLEGTVSILRNLSGGEIYNLSCNWDSLLNVWQ